MFILRKNVRYGAGGLYVHEVPRYIFLGSSAHMFVVISMQPPCTYTRGLVSGGESVLWKIDSSRDKLRSLVRMLQNGLKAKIAKKSRETDRSLKDLQTPLHVFVIVTIKENVVFGNKKIQWKANGNQSAVDRAHEL